MTKQNRSKFAAVKAPNIVALFMLVLICQMLPLQVQAGGSSSEVKLDMKIPPFDKKNYQKLNASHENPFITIYDNKVVLSWIKANMQKKSSLMEFLAPSAIFRFRPGAVERALKRLKVFMNPWPCA